MKLYSWRGETRNFGDELNTMLWPALLPALFDDNEAEIVLGIGSVLDNRHAPNQLKIVIGAGYGGYQPLPRMDRSWVIHWVRGPVTAALLGLDPAIGLGDPAMLWPFRPNAGECEGPATGQVGFMPHFESLDRGPWAEVAATAGLRLIDPTGPPGDVLAQIAACKLLVSEAMHGAIMADTLRVPWIAIQPLAAIHRAKWQDWGKALGMRIDFRQLPASSLFEWASGSPVAGWRGGRKAIQMLARCPVGSGRFQDNAARALRHIAAGPGQLSELAQLRRCQDRMLTRLDTVRRQPRGQL